MKSDFQYGSMDQKQHLNLSSLAYETIQNDMFSFMQKPSLAGFINRILENYCDSADASIGHAGEREYERLSGELSALPNSSEKAKIIDVLVAKHQNELAATSASYPKGTGFNFRLNTNNFNVLYDPANPYTELEFYDHRPGKYIKAVIEEYARQTPLRREEIFFSETLSQLSAYIESNTYLELHILPAKATTPRIYKVKPYAIRIDDSALYHYLIGITLSNQENSTPRISSMRISRIQKIKPTRSRSGKVTEREREDIETRIHDSGIQFLLDDQEDIKVRLTPKGCCMFKAQLHLRPAPVSIDDNIYSFRCTQGQAEFYFFKFGQEAEIISPLELRERFQDKYRMAYEMYSEEEGYSSSTC